MAAQIEVSGVTCDNPIGAGSNGGVSYDCTNSGDAACESTLVWVTVQGPEGQEVGVQGEDACPLQPGESRHFALVIDGSNFNECGTYTVTVAADGGGSGSCTFEVR